MVNYLFFVLTLTFLPTFTMEIAYGPLENTLEERPNFQQFKSSLKKLQAEYDVHMKEFLRLQSLIKAPTGDNGVAIENHDAIIAQITAITNKLSNISTAITQLGNGLLTSQPHSPDCLHKK